MDTKVNGQRCWLSHYPHAYWPASHKGSFHLYGHTHDQREATLDAVFPGRRSHDAGLDTAFRRFGVHRPFTEMEVFDYLINRPGHDLPEFYQGSYK